MDELLRSSRDNIAETYLGLGAQAGTSEIVRTPAFEVCRAQVDLAFCNFAVRLRLDAHPEGAESAAEDLAAFARRRRSFRVFAATGDTPAEVSMQLDRAGFRPAHRLIQMACASSDSPAEIDLIECGTLFERHRVTEFMVSQFFGRQSQVMKSHIVTATVHSDHRLFRLEHAKKIVAAVMLTGMKDAVGLYNLCVLPSARHKGTGGAVVHSVLSLAAKLGLPTVLQCEPALEPWYKEMGFNSVGIVQAFSLNPSHF